MNRQLLRQVRAIAAVELRRILLGRRGLVVLVLALAPVALAVAVLFARERFGGPVGTAELQQIFAWIFHTLVLRTVVFFGVMWVFVNAIRGEVVDRTLHLLLLLPVPRPALLGGKFLAGLVATAGVFGTSTALAWLAIFRHRLDSAPFGDLGWWLLIVALGCVGYGAIFATLGIYLRNPVFAAIGLFGWEWIEFLLPGPLKKLSVAHYLKNLAPVRLDEGPFAIVASSTPAPLAILGLFVFAAALLWIGAHSLKRLEIDYGAE